MILKNGVDIIEISRIEKAYGRFGHRFLQHVYTEREVLESQGRAEVLAVQFAAKEAVTKALGTGIGPVGWKDVETLHRPSGEPFIILHGRGKKVADYLGLTTWAVSLSHSREFGVAMVVATGE